MEEKDKIKLRIGKLKDEKEDIKFEIGKYLDYLLATSIFLGSVGVSVILSIPQIELKALVGSIFILTMIIFYLRVFHFPLGNKVKKLEEIKNHIKIEYYNLFKNNKRAHS